MFNESLFDTELFWYSFGDFITYTAIITIATVEIWLLLRWWNRNKKETPMNIKNYHSYGNTNNNSQQSYDVDEKQKTIGVIDVEVKKDIFIDEPDSVDIKTDEVVKGKVMTNKNKLRSLRK